LRRRSRSHEQNRCQDQTQLFLRHCPLPLMSQAPVKSRVILRPSDKDGRRISIISVWQARLLKRPVLYYTQTIRHASRTASAVSPERVLKSRCVANQPCSKKF
jgi:hypothetical protein